MGTVAILAQVRLKTSACGDVSLMPQQKSSYAGNLTLHVLEPKGQPTHSFVFLHGFTCSGEDYASDKYWFAHANTTPYPGLRVVCPDAHLLKISAPGYDGKRERAWYDYLTDHDGEAEDDLDISTLDESCREIHAIVQAEAEIVGSLSRVFVGGNSQGCGAAFHAVATAPRGTIGGFFGSIGHVLACTDVSTIADRIDGPIVFYCGADDDTIMWSWAKETFKRLAGVPRVELWREDEVEHEDDGKWTANFFARVLPPPGVLEQLLAYEEYDNEEEDRHRTGVRATPRLRPMARRAPYTYKS